MTTLEDERGPGPGFYFMFCVWQSSVRGCRVSFVFVYFIKMCFKCSPVPASFFPYLSTSLHSRVRGGSEDWRATRSSQQVLLSDIDIVVC